SEFLTLGAVGGLRTADMIFTLVSFIVLLALLKKFAWGPLMDVMEKREEYVKDEIETAEKNRKEAEIASKEAKAQLRQTKEEAQKNIDDARKTKKQEEQKIIRTAREEATSLKQAAEADIQNEKEKTIQALQDQVVLLSVLIASKVIEKE